MSKADDVFWRQFGVVLILLTLFGFAMYFVANAIGGQAYAKMRSDPAAVAERIAPFGRSRIGDPAGQTQAPAQVALAAPAASAAAPRSGSEIYGAACVACHATGAAGSPLFGDGAAWTERAAQGFEALTASVLSGKGAMPPKAGNPALTEDEIRSAISYMLKEAGVEADGAPAAESVGAASESTATAAVQAGAAQSAAPVAAKDEAPAAGSAAGSGSQEQVATAAGGPVVDTAAGGKIYQTACIACHLTGVAEAPKLDDKAAWESRLAALGMDGLVQSVTAGKGAMPPKGGFMNLTEDDLRNAVGFMLGKAGLLAEG